MVSSDNAPDPHAVIANRDEIAKALRRAADDVSTLPVSALIDPDNAVSAALLAHTTAAVEHLVKAVRHTVREAPATPVRNVYAVAARSRILVAGDRLADAGVHLEAARELIVHETAAHPGPHALVPRELGDHRA